MPFGQHGHIFNTASLKKRLDFQEVHAQYLIAIGPDPLLVWKSERKTIATIGAKEFILSQYQPQEKLPKESLFEQAAKIPIVDNTAYDSWYADWILHPFNTQEKV